MRRLTLLMALVLLLNAAYSYAQRTGICWLNCSSDITTCTDRNSLVCDANGVWQEQPRNAWLCSTQVPFSGAVTGNRYWFADTNDSTPVADDNFTAPEAGQFNKIACHCDIATAASHTRNFTLFKGADASRIGPCAMGAGATTCTFSTGSPASYAAGDVGGFRLVHSPDTGTDNATQCNCCAS